MCRFLLARFQEPTSPQELLQAFANMSEKSKALDGDWQGDGWGVAWSDSVQGWQRHVSLAPIWQDTDRFSSIPATHTLVAHARAASFPQHKGVIEFNQPYLFDRFAFVFNGLLKGVSLPNIPGRIGAEKIRFLVREELKVCEPQEALERVRVLLHRHCREIVALNIGLATSEGIYSLNHFSCHPEYYALHRWNDDQTHIICSEPLMLEQEVLFTPIGILQPTYSPLTA